MIVYTTSVIRFHSWLVFYASALGVSSATSTEVSAHSCVFSVSEDEPSSSLDSLTSLSQPSVSVLFYCPMPPKLNPPWGIMGCSNANWFPPASIPGARFWSSSSSKPKYSSRIFIAFS